MSGFAYEYRLTALKSYVNHSKRKNNAEILNKVITIKPEYSKLFILISFEKDSFTSFNDTTDTLDYVITKLNSNTDDAKI